MKMRKQKKKNRKEFDSKNYRNLSELKNFIQMNCDSLSEEDLEELNADIQGVTDEFDDSLNRLNNIENLIKQKSDEILDDYNKKKFSLEEVQKKFQKIRSEIKKLTDIKDEIGKCLGE